MIYNNYMEIYSNNHSVFNLHYHLILVTKYRKQILNRTFPVQWTIYSYRFGDFSRWQSRFALFLMKSVMFLYFRID